MIRYYALLTLSVIFIIFGLTVNAQTMNVLNEAVVSVYTGYGLRQFLEPIAGILANGKISLISPALVKFILFVSMITAYISIYKISNRNTGNRLRDIFTGAYWRHLDIGLTYKPVKIKKK